MKTETTNTAAHWKLHRFASGESRSKFFKPDGKVAPSLMRKIKCGAALILSPTCEHINGTRWSPDDGWGPENAGGVLTWKGPAVRMSYTDRIRNAMAFLDGVNYPAAKLFAA